MSAQSTGLINSFEKITKLELDGSNLREHWINVGQCLTSNAFVAQKDLMIDHLLPCTHIKHEKCIYDPIYLGSSGGALIPETMRMPNVIVADCFDGYVGTPMPSLYGPGRSKSPSTTRQSEDGRDGSGGDDAHPGVGETETVEGLGQRLYTGVQFNAEGEAIKYGFYEGDPLAYPSHKVKQVLLIDVVAAEIKFTNDCIQAASLVERTFSASALARLKASKLFTEAVSVGRIDIMKMVVDRIIMSKTTIALPPRAIDKTMLGELKDIINMKPLSTFIETKEALHEKIRRLRLKGWDPHRTPENDCMMGVLLYTLGSTTRIGRLTQEDSDKDLLRFPECTLQWAENRILSHEGSCMRSDDNTDYSRASIKAAPARKLQQGAQAGRGSGATAAGRGAGKPDAKSDSKKYCAWCRKEGDHYTSFCTDSACPESVKEDAKKLFQNELAAKRSINSLRKTGK